MIPLIDISRLETDPQARAALDRACRDWGVFDVVGHALAPALCEQLLEATRAFFALPSAQKLAVSRSADNPWGFYDRELTNNARDSKEIFDFGPAGCGIAATPWPAGLPCFRPALERYYEAAVALAMRLLRAISGNLGQPETALDPCFDTEHTSFLRLNYYPPATSSDSALGVHQHTDAGALTVLLQDSLAGLQLWHDQRWQTIAPRPGALTINLGDIVQVWSNDRYRAARHRVLASGESARYSAPLFLNPSYATDYAPLETTVTPQSPVRYRSINWGEFRAGRAAGDYADLGEEIQITQFRLD